MCEVLLNYPRIGGQDVEDYEKKDIRNILHTNIDVHSRGLIVKFPGDETKCIENFQSCCANMTFADKSRYYMVFKRVTNKGG